MPVTLTLHAGQPAVVLESRGKPAVYMLDRLPAPPKQRRYRLRKEGGEEYTVSVQNGIWRCDCKAWKYSRGLVRDCKHCLALRSLRTILAAFFAGLHSKAVSC